VFLMGSLLLAVCASLFSQSRRAFSTRQLRDYEKVEPGLALKAAGNHAGWGEPIPVIVQFATDSADGSEMMNAPRLQIEDEQLELEHNRVILAAGGIPKDHFTHLSALTALVDREALGRLAR
jgi:hypothetical protein